MTLAKLRVFVPGLILAALPVFAQDNSSAAQTAGNPKATQQADGNQTSSGKKIDRAAAYYHFSLAHIYEEMVAMYGRSEYANKAIEEYRLAIENDPSSEYLNAGLAELYLRTDRLRDAILEAQDIIKRNPDNLEARKLLGTIYLHSMEDRSNGSTNQDVLKAAIEQYEAIVRLQPNNVESHLILGQLYSRNRETLKAEPEFNTALKLDPTSEDAVVNLSILYNEEGNSTKAAEVLSSVPEKEKTSKMYSALGFTYERMRDYKKSIAAYQQALNADHENLDALRGLAENLTNDNQMDAALGQYQALEQANPQDYQAPLHMAEIYRRQGKFQLALEKLKKAESLTDDSLEIAYNKVLTLEALGRYDEAADALQKILTKTAQPKGAYSASDRANRALFLIRLGTIYREEGRPLLAVDTFRKMIELGDEEAARGYQEIIDLYREQKQWADATKTAREATAKLPDDKGIKYAMALQLADDGKADESLQIAKSMLKENGEDREGYISLSQIYSRLRRWTEAEQALDTAEKFSPRPDDKEYIQFLRGSLFERQKKYSEAEGMFRKVLEHDPNNAMTLNYLGYMLADRGTHLDEAVALIKQALTMEPQNGAYLDSMGWAHFRTGNYDQAEEFLRKAVDKNPTDPTVQDHLAEVYAKTGRLKLAAAHWERALEEWSKSAPADVDQQDVARVQKELESTKVKLAQKHE